MASEQEGLDRTDYSPEEIANDLAWIERHSSDFWPAAKEQFKANGKGVIVVKKPDSQDETNVDSSMYYLPEKTVKQAGDERLQRMLNQYDPDKEFVIALMKPDGLTKFRMQIPELDPLPERVPRGKPKRGKL